MADELNLYRQQQQIQQLLHLTANQNITTGTGTSSSQRSSLQLSESRTLQEDKNRMLAAMIEKVKRYPCMEYKPIKYSKTNQRRTKH